MNTCPYLGLEEDAYSAAGFPSDRNFCFRSKNPAAILLDHQQKYCLGKKYHECLVFQNSIDLPIPLELRRDEPVKRKETKSWLYWTLLSFVVLSILVSANLLFPKEVLKNVTPTPIGNNFVIATDQAPVRIEYTLTPFVISTATETVTPTTISSTLTSTAEPTLTSTITPYPESQLALEVPRSGDPTLLIHNIVPGDTIENIEERYNTTIEAIKSINYFLPIPFWADWKVVIPLNTSDVSNLPTFEAYQVKQDNLTIEKLAKIVNSDLDLLILYNQWQSPNNLPFDSWILIPREGTLQTNP